LDAAEKGLARWAVRENLGTVTRVSEIGFDDPVEFDPRHESDAAFSTEAITGKRIKKRKN
jgi:hypothetical protein